MLEVFSTINLSDLAARLRSRWFTTTACHQLAPDGSYASISLQVSFKFT